MRKTIILWDVAYPNGLVIPQDVILIDRDEIVPVFVDYDFNKPPLGEASQWETNEKALTAEIKFGKEYQEVLDADEYAFGPYCQQVTFDTERGLVTSGVIRAVSVLDVQPRAIQWMQNPTGRS